MAFSDQDRAKTSEVPAIHDARSLCALM